MSGYVIVSEIGRGGMGIVYRAHDLKLGRMVALKRPKPEVMALPDFTGRFLREARTASKLLHPNITTVFAAYEQDGVPWLVMELVAGASLRDRLASGGPLPVGAIVEHAVGLADALRAAHEQGILHSDVNPNNILIGRDGRARLTDFGLARARNAPGEAPVFGDGDAPTWSAPEAAGTRGYMAPEHLRGRGLDPRSDLYCLGLVLFEMCVGTPVFAGKSTVEWVGAAMEGETERLTRLGPEVPPELARIIAKATATKPQRRYQSAAEMVADLKALRRFRESGVEIAVADAARARKRTHYGVLAAAVLAVAGVALVVTLRSGTGAVVLNPRRLTSAPGWESHPALSPDGTMVAYCSNESGNADIWLVSVATGESRRLTDDPDSDTDPTWFPDGRTIAFVSNRGGPPAVWTVSAATGNARLLLAGAIDPDVSPDGTLLAVAARQPNGLTRIAVAPVADPDRLRLLSPGEGFWDERDPAWSPDGRRVAYTDFRDVWVIEAEGGRAARITGGEGGSIEPTWSPDGHSIVCSSTRKGERALWRIRVPGGDAVRLTAGTDAEVQPMLSADGARLVYATRRRTSSIEILDLAGRASQRAIALSGLATMPALDPQGRFLVFVRNRLEHTGLWRRELSASDFDEPPRRLVEMPGTVAKSAVTPDGRFVAFHRVVDGERDIWVVPAQGGEVVPLVKRRGADIHPAFSPDGASMAFVSDSTGEQHVWVVGIQDGRVIGEPRQVTNGPGSDLCPSWSPDGRRIAFIRHQGEDADVWIADLSGRESGGRVTSGELVDLLQWESGREAILVACRRHGRNSELRRITLADGRNEPFVPAVVFGGPDDWGVFSASADGRFLAVAVGETTGDLWLADTGI